MEPINFKEVAALINRVGNTTLGKDPAHQEKEQWEIYEGFVQSGGISVKFSVIYLLSEITVEGFRSARSAARQLPAGTPIQFVYPNSLADKYSAQVKKLSDVTPNVLSLSSYFASFVRQQLDTYLEKIKALPHRHYVDPQITVLILPLNSGVLSRTIMRPSSTVPRARYSRTASG